MGIKTKVLNITSGVLCKTIHVFGGSRASQIAGQLAEDLSVTVTQDTDFGKIRFFCPGKLPALRAQTILTKEPETLKWIGTFKDNDILWDIGANIGVYSLYAALKGQSVLAFEPSPGNYYLLAKNIEINKLDDKIFAYCMAFSDRTKLDTYFMANTELGGALNSFGEAVDWQGKPIIVRLRQAMIGFRVDDFIKQYNPPFPNHIKIDVDGIEDKIIAGAKQTLSDKRLKSVLVELNIERTGCFKRATDLLTSSGLVLETKSCSPEGDDRKVTSVSNHIFVRPE